MADATTKRSHLFWMLPLVTLAIGYAFGRHRSAVEPPTIPPHDAATTAPATIVKPERVSAPTVARREMPATPAKDLPLAQSFDALAQRARAGDANASLRLLHEMRLCQERPMLEHMVSSPDIEPHDLDKLPEKVRQAFRADIAERETKRAQAREKYEAFATLCAGVTTAELATLGEWLERAADSGDPGAGLCYVMAATSDGYAPAERYSDAWVEWMERYRTKAYTYAERAFAAGYPTASWYLHYVAAGPYAISPFLLDHDVPPDYARAYALALLQSALIARNAIPAQAREDEGWQESARQLSVNLDENAIALARQWADAQAARIAASEPREPPCGDRIDSL